MCRDSHSAYVCWYLSVVWSLTEEQVTRLLNITVNEIEFSRVEFVKWASAQLFSVRFFSPPDEILNPSRKPLIKISWCTVDILGTKASMTVHSFIQHSQTYTGGTMLWIWKLYWGFYFWKLASPWQSQWEARKKSKEQVSWGLWKSFNREKWFTGIRFPIRVC